MRTQEGINTRILREVDNLSISNERKELLRSLLAFELEVYDQARPHFKEIYKTLISKALTRQPK